MKLTCGGTSRNLFHSINRHRRSARPTCSSSTSSPLCRNSLQAVLSTRRLPLRILPLTLLIAGLTGCGINFNSRAPGQVTVSQSSITWGKVAVGQTSGPKTATLTNSGAAAIKISGIDFTGTNAGDFAMDQNTCGSTLAPSASCTFTILFKPTTSGTRTATLTFTDTGGNSPQEVALSGVGVGSSGAVTLSPASLSFGSVSVGGSSASQTITLTNRTSASVTLSGAGIAGTNAADFAVSSTTCGSSLAASASCSANVLFHPTATGARAATWSVNDGSGALSVALSGSGVSSTGTATVAPTSIDWPQVNVGQAGVAQSATLTNTGNTSISISSVTLTGTNPGDFAIDQQTCDSTLAASASCTVTILFKPTASGTRAAMLTFTDGASNSPQQVALSGAGEGSSTGTVTAAPSSLPFGNVILGSTSTPQTITISNSTSSSVALGAAAISGANSADFATSSTTCGSSLAASASCTANVLFKPTATGARAATWSISDGSGSLSVALSGSGIQSTGTVTAAPSNLSFGSISLGSSSAAQTLTVTNSGSSSVTLNAAAISGANAADFAISSTTCGSSLAASASCTASITFTPAATGARAAAWTINDSSGSLSVTLTGTGVEASNTTFTASPSSLAWGTVTFGQTGTSKTATLTNNGGAPVLINSITVTGADAADFSISSNTCGTSLAAAASCTATLLFAPKATGDRTATLSFDDAAGNSPQTIALSGTGGASTSGNVTVSPATLTFPQTEVGQASSAMSATVLNGGASTISISGITIQGAQAGDFIQSSTCGATLASSASCQISVTFKPSASGTRTAFLNVADNASNSPQTVSLSGVGSSGTPGTATVNPSIYSFGNYAVGASSAVEQIYLKNNGPSTISYSGAALSGVNAADFYITAKSCGSSLGANQSCYIDVIFSPSAIGARTATLTFTDGATNSPQTVALSGNGTSAPTATLTISPSSLNWGSQAVGLPGASQSFTLTAGGSGDVSFSSFGFTGANAGDFSISANTCGATLAQGGSCTVSITFTPSAIGNRVALFSVVDNAIANPQTTEVSGSGAYSNPQTASVTIDLGSRSGDQVPIPANILGTEYLESLPTNDNRATVFQGGFTTARYRLDVSTVYTTSDSPHWGGVDADMTKLVAAGVHPLIELVNTPAFLQPSPPCSQAAPSTSVPTDVNEWGKLAASFVAHFDQKFPGFVTRYEIWNEPDTAALCSSNREQDYISIYAAAAPQMKAQAKADGVTILVGGPANAGPAWTDLLHNPATAPYMDFYSYHLYEGTSTDTKNGMTWDGAGGTPSLYQMIINPSSGVQARYLQADNGIKSATSPMGANTPIYFDEYNDDWDFVNDCCRNSPTYSPLFNSMTVAQLLNSIYEGANQVPSMMIYYSAGQRTFCILGVIDPAMDCTKAATGAQAQPYPQWYTYRLMFNPSYLDLQDGGHMAASVSLSSAASSAGIIATGWYTAAMDSILLINPTATSFSAITVQVNNPGLSAPTTTLYTINAQNPQVSQWPAATISASGGLQTTFDLPPYSVIALSLK